MAFGMKGMARDWGPGLVRVSGSFEVNAAGAVVNTRPSRPGWNCVANATGVYVVTLDQAFLSVVHSDSQIAPATEGGNIALPTAIPSGGFSMVTKDFFTANTANLITDTTNKNVVITVFTAPTGGSAANVAANYRCSFELILAESAVNK